MTHFVNLDNLCGISRNMRTILIAILALSSASCSMSWEKGEGGVIEVHRISFYDINQGKIARMFPAVKNKSAIYKDSYLGSFTYYYTPKILNEDTVLVPQVHCYIVEPDVPEEDYERYITHSRCAYSETQRCYVNNPRNIFTVDDDIDMGIAKKIAVAWYEQMQDYLYIESIVKVNGDYFVDQSGNACIGRYFVQIQPSGEIQFGEPEVLLCS